MSVAPTKIDSRLYRRGYAAFGNIRHRRHKAAMSGPRARQLAESRSRAFKRTYRDETQLAPLWSRRDSLRRGGGCEQMAGADIKRHNERRR